MSFVFSEHGSNDDQEYARLSASTKTASRPPADMIADSGFTDTAATAGQFVPVSAANVPDLAGVQKPLLAPVNGRASPAAGRPCCSRTTRPRW